MITERLSTKVTERLARPSLWAGRIELAKIGLMAWAIVLLILYAARAVVQMDSQAFAVLAAFGVAGVVYVFKKWG